MAVGAVLALTGVGVLAVVLRLLLGTPDLGQRARTTSSLETGLPATGLPATGDVALTAWPAVCLFGGLLVLAAGGLVLVRGPRWRSLDARYEAPGAATRAATPAATADPDVGSPPAERALWEALDRGEDPTAGSR